MSVTYLEHQKLCRRNDICTHGQCTQVTQLVHGESRTLELHYYRAVQVPATAMMRTRLSKRKPHPSGDIVPEF
jgi:hypothetical protein